MPDCFNSIYKKLVSSEDDFVGMVAYSIYKNSKRVYIDNFISEYNRPPDEEALKEFYRNSQIEPTIKLYLSRAEKIIEEFTVKIAQNEIDGIADQMRQMSAEMYEKEQYHKKRLEEEKDAFIQRIDKIKPSRWYTGVFQSIIAAFLVLLFYIVAVIHFNLFGLNDGIEKRITNRIIQKTQDTR